MEHQHTSHDHSQHSMNSPMEHDSHVGHNKHAGHNVADFWKRLFFACNPTLKRVKIIIDEE